MYLSNNLSYHKGVPQSIMEIVCKALEMLAGNLKLVEMHTDFFFFFLGFKKVISFFIP